MDTSDYFSLKFDDSLKWKKSLENPEIINFAHHHLHINHKF